MCISSLLLILQYLPIVISRSVSGPGQLHHGGDLTFHKSGTIKPFGTQHLYSWAGMGNIIHGYEIPAYFVQIDAPKHTAVSIGWPESWY